MKTPYAFFPHFPFHELDDKLMEISFIQAEQVWIYCRKELGVGEITKTINKFNPNHEDIDTPSRKTLMHNARKELLSPVKHESLVKHVIRVDSVPKNKPPDHVLLLGIIVSTAIATLALFVLMVFCCLGGIHPRARSQCAQQDKKPKPIVNISPEGISGIKFCLES